MYSTYSLIQLVMTWYVILPAHEVIRECSVRVYVYMCVMGDEQLLSYYCVAAAGDMSHAGALTLVQLHLG